MKRGDCGMSQDSSAADNASVVEDDNNAEGVPRRDEFSSQLDSHLNFASAPGGGSVADFGSVDNSEGQGQDSVKQVNVNNRVPSQPVKKLSYANTASRSVLPTFKQSVVLDAIEGVTNDQYMDEYEKVMDINNLINCSKISENRVLFTVDSEAAANVLLSKTITVNNQQLPFRPFLLDGMVNKQRRVVVSNVLPQIPNDIIIDRLKDLNILTKNGITNIRCSTSNEFRRHVQSHRRQFYVKETDLGKIPNMMKINFHDILHICILQSSALC